MDELSQEEEEGADEEEEEEEEGVVNLCDASPAGDGESAESEELAPENTGTPAVSGGMALDGSGCGGSDRLIACICTGICVCD